MLNDDTSIQIGLTEYHARLAENSENASLVVNRGVPA